jgi:hypothetical protein
MLPLIEFDLELLDQYSISRMIFADQVVDGVGLQDQRLKAAKSAQGAATWGRQGRLGREGPSRSDGASGPVGRRADATGSP